MALKGVHKPSHWLWWSHRMPWTTGDWAAPHKHCIHDIHTAMHEWSCAEIYVCVCVYGWDCAFHWASLNSSQRFVKTPLCVLIAPTHGSNRLFSSCVQKTHLWRLSAKIVVSTLTRWPFQVNLLLVSFFLSCVCLIVCVCVPECTWNFKGLKREKKSVRSTCHRGFIVREFSYCKCSPHYCHTQSLTYLTLMSPSITHKDTDCLISYNFEKTVVFFVCLFFVCNCMKLIPGRLIILLSHTPFQCKPWFKKNNGWHESKELHCMRQHYISFIMWTLYQRRIERIH